jgi:hypothetical protein
MGKPIEGLDKPFGAMCWLRDLLKREDLQYLPETLQLRKDVEVELERIGRLSEEHRVRAAIEALNAEIVKVNTTAIDGPPSSIAPFDAEVFLNRWRERRRNLQG